MTRGFQPPPYLDSRVEALRAVADRRPGGVVDLSIGTPCDPPPPAVIAALAASGAERGYPPSIGSPAFREAAARWLKRRFGAEVEPAHVAACIGTKELVAGLPHWLRLRRPDRDTILYPQISYPTYAMGATLAGCRAVPYGGIEDVSDADASRALCLWVNTPANPTGTLVDLAPAVAWGRHHGVPVVSDECYIEFTWDRRGESVLHHGTEGLLALHSLSKRSNLAGTRVGFYAGDPDLVDYLSQVRRHAGFMVPGPVQAAAVAALDDDEHVDAQRARYRGRLERLAGALRAYGVDCDLPAGTFFLWVRAPGGDGWGLARALAGDGGALVSPGQLYGPAGQGHVRIAVIQPDDRLALVGERLAAAGAVTL